MSPAAVPGVTYSRVHPSTTWLAPGRPSLPGTFGVGAPWINRKDSGGLVSVVGSNLVNVEKYGVDHYVMKASDGVSWAAIEPSRGVYDWRPVDNILAARGKRKGALRIQAGDTAPGWLKTLTGTVEMYNASRGITVNVCHYWEDVAMGAWQNMITAAGARYDQDPRVTMVSAALPTSVFSESFILGNDGPSAIRLYNAGLDLPRLKNVIERCVNDTVAAFPNTLVELAVHLDLQYPTATGVKASKVEARDLALKLATAHGRHLCISDYGLGSTEGGRRPAGTTITTELEIYAWMYLRSLEANKNQPWAGPVSFQLTVGKEPQVQATYVNAGDAALSYNASMCETAGWGLAAEECARLDSALRANAKRWSI